jgi:cyclase
MLFNGLQVIKTIRFSSERNLGPAAQFARVYNARNVDELIFIDLNATAQKREPDYDTILEVFNECFMPLTIGGGIHSIEHVERLMKIGADKVCVQSEALLRPEFITEIAKTYGSQAAVVSIDAKKINGDYYVFKNRGKENTGILVTEWVKKIEKFGAGEIFLNSIDTDGMLQGYDIELIKKVTSIATIPVIACGGAGKVQDIIDAVTTGGSNAAALASMFHYSGHTPNSIKERMDKVGIPVRLMREHYES